MADKDARAELPGGAVDLLILKTLSLAPLHGYGIAQHILQLSGNALRLEQGSLYPALQRLELQGLITAEWRLTPTKRRARYYELTAAGREALGLRTAGFEEMLVGLMRVIRAT